MRKKIFAMLIIVLIGLVAAWGIINRKVIYKKAGAAKNKIASISSKIPFVNKLFHFKAEKKNAEEKKAGKKKQAEKIEVKAFKVAQIHFIDTLPVIGTIKSSKKIIMRFQINGVIASFNFRRGDMVEEGDIVTELTHTDAQLKIKFREAKVESARTRMMAAKKKLEQYKQLFSVGAIIKSKLDEVDFGYQNAEGEFKAAQVELESAKLEMEKTYLKSPIDGVLATKDIEEGEYVTSSMQVATLGKISDVFLEMGIIEKDIERIQLGQDVNLKVDTYPDEEYKGKIDNIFPTIEGKSRTITVRAKIANPYNKLLPGMFARAWITVYEKQNAVIAPPLGIEKTEKGYQAFVIDKKNTVHPTPVDVEYTGNTEYWVIGKGLQQGDIIVNEVVSGQFSQLKEGVKVKVLETEEYTF